jgi:ribonuclease HI
MGSDNLLRVTIHIDGGARGNPGPAGAGVVVRCSDDGTVLHEAGFYLGRATNNVAEYSALLAGLKAARQLRAGEVHVFSDSQLLVRQMNGAYRVRNHGLKPLYEQARALVVEFEQFEIFHVSREQNIDADRLVNEAIDAGRNIRDADG